MATDRQLEIIADLEAAAKAIRNEGIPPGHVKISLLCERAGLAPQAIRPVAESLEIRQDFESLGRMKKAFSVCSKMPSFLQNIKNVDSERPKAAEDLPPTARVRLAKIQESVRQEVSSSDELAAQEVQSQVIRMILPFGMTHRTRILDSAHRFLLGVGND